LGATFAGRPLNVLITHIDRHQDHASEIRQVAHLFQSLQEPVILMGDFNLIQDESGQHNDPDAEAIISAPGSSTRWGRVTTAFSRGDWWR